jgi:hypothetical protein
MENTRDWRSRLLEMMLVKERDPGGGGALVSVWDKFAVDSPLEGAGFELAVPRKTRPSILSGELLRHWTGGCASTCGRGLPTLPSTRSGV